MMIVKVFEIGNLRLCGEKAVDNNKMLLCWPQRPVSHRGEELILTSLRR